MASPGPSNAYLKTSIENLAGKLWETALERKPMQVIAIATALKSVELFPVFTFDLAFLLREREND
jgi:hypothetical protein